MCAYLIFFTTQEADAHIHPALMVPWGSPICFNWHTSGTRNMHYRNYTISNGTRFLQISMVKSLDTYPSFSCYPYNIVLPA